jgi:branched-chain amino acid transport system substrate-binding protein
VRRRALYLIIAVVVVAIVVALAVALPTYYAPKPPVPGKVKIGCVLSLSGALSGFGVGAEFGAKAAVEDINKLGGVYLSKYGVRVPVELIVRDSGSDWEKASAVATDLITREGVHVLVAWEPTIPVYLAAERHKCPCIGVTPFEPYWAHGPYNYSWNIALSIATRIVPEKGYTLIDAFFGYLDKFVNQTNRVVALIACGDPDGEGWYRTFGPELQKRGFKVVGFEKNLGLYPPGTTDFSSIIMEWKAAGAEILWGNLPGPDFGIVLRQMDILGFNPKVIQVGRAALFYEDVIAWGDNLPYGVGTEVWWSPYYPPEKFPGIGGTTPASLAERWYKATGRQINRAVGAFYGIVQTAIAAIERAGSLDREEINKAIASLDIDTILQHVDFKGDKLKYHFCPGPVTFGQWCPAPPPTYWELKITYSDVPYIPIEHDPIFPARPHP